MRLHAFNIKNFRSIVNTGWCPFSRDHVTVLVGQNESGKSSILEALHCLLSGVSISEDDLRAAAPLPEMNIRCEFSAQELTDAIDEENWSSIQEDAFHSYAKRCKFIFELKMTWRRSRENDSKFAYDVTILDEQLENVLTDSKRKQKNIDLRETALDNLKATVSAIATATPIPSIATPTEENEEEEEEEEGEIIFLTSSDIAHCLHNASPSSTLFNPATGLLPNTVDIDEKFNLIGVNKLAASNYLQIAGLDLKHLLNTDRRERQFLLNKAREKISKDFNLFWTQTIGKNRKLEIGCEIEFYSSEAGDKAGKPHLVFGISDGHSMLYPKQRSEGVRWFVSFYLQLKASESRGLKRIFLMDEPGANLHPKAQEDVLRLVNSLSSGIEIVYSTHSSALLEFNKLYRVHAVQRTGDEDESPTEIIDAHSLSAASTDTLTPLLMAMGIDLSSQNVIKREHNVLLEEISGFYYFNAFWKLRDCKQPAHFIAATGASNIPTLANMFTGWGLKFIAVIDDDNLGRTVYKQLKQELCGDDEAIASERLWKIRDCSGIEDIFSHRDFKSHILRDTEANFSIKNTEFLKSAKRSKPVMAYQFWEEVQAGRLTSSNLEPETLKKIDEIVTEVSKRLEKHKSS
ncbi:MULTISPECIES: AAA family ATPase [unclassified Variovorax]|jgi:ABC-type lipoprotein export system ATPase subunit|uniref:ATP-dependent nuclease n=1 Tax=unclassified Variovorax TaxID=663243 RepID=UPI0013DF78D7|nr:MULTISPECIES: AAA family ATPase [unclassified Variovorax]